MNENAFIPTIRHLDDETDLKKYGRNPPIKEGQEEVVEDFASEILNSLDKNVKFLFFITSSKLRCVQTAQAIKNSIKIKCPDLKITISENGGLSNLDDGDFILPADYKDGDLFQGFKVAGKIFTTKVFDDSDLLYKYGDSNIDQEGERFLLQEYFRSPGSNYKDFLLNFFNSILEFSKNINRFDKRIRPVIITHSQQYQMLYDLCTIAIDLLGNKIIIEPGEIYKECWTRYKKRVTKELPPIYDVRYLDMSVLANPQIIDRLNAEIKALEETR